ncbi:MULTISPECIES: 3'-5' exonuclease [Enterobacteriaceae]|jgi:DNA polymerase-3 subunit epsilon|nr:MULTISPECIES: 3'-5' exonuclease [Enterobacteriaceae]EAP8847694.1 3'-5' exonuclease [Salmonella enterica]EGD5057164.1 3'-5' exonuclease [Escherichia coli]EGD5130795.1 3'-5' exonuclease [Escherichia coli]EHY2995104.1 3'-5' exonuclease [Escherichia coli]EJE7200566.1 3'-5' exonuclease [Escherichia coli]
MTDTSNINEMSEKYKKILDEGCIILDTETTDLYGEVIELAIINNEGSVLFNHRIKPKEQKIKPNAEAIHHISMEMLKDEKELSFYMDELTDIFTKYKNLVIYNAAFDIECLNVSLNANDFQEFKVIFGINIKCAMRDYAYYYNEYNDYFNDYKWQRLETAAKRFDFDFTNITPHEALSDCFMTLHVIESMAKKKTEKVYNLSDFFNR